MIIYNRRDFLKSCCVATATMAASGTQLSFAAPGSNCDNVIIYLFLRGGIDGLSLIPPIAGADRGYYETYRPNIKIPLSGNNAALPLNNLFGIHPSAAKLKTLYDAGHLAVVQSVGILPSDVASRSHFEAQNFIEYGTPGSTSIGTGWLTRHLMTAPNIPANAVLTAVSAGSNAPASLQGDMNAMTINSTNNFVPNNHWKWRDSHLASLDSMYQGNSSLDLAVQSALNAVEVIDSLDFDAPPAGGASYPNGSLGDGLELIAKLINQNVGLSAATVDYGGWDTHSNQGENGGGYFSGRISELSEAIYAFFTDVSASGYGDCVTLVVQSEFGRRVRQNDDRGTDHGSGNMMLVLDRKANGGQIHGSFAGLAHAQLFGGEDLAVTTDFRNVLGEILTVKQGNPNIDQIFPDFNSYSAIGLYPELPVFSSSFD